MCAFGVGVLGGGVEVFAYVYFFYEASSSVYLGVFCYFLKPQIVAVLHA